MLVQGLGAEGGVGVCENDAIFGPYFGFAPPNGLMASWGLAMKIKDKSITMAAMLERFFHPKYIVQYLGRRMISIVRAN